jgi:hypothetical protein
MRQESDQVDDGSEAYILKKPSPRGGGISANVIWGENMKRGRETEENVREKGRKGEEKGRKRENWK